jgi:multidrug transporter EmrE-like cation transporter
MDARLPMQHYIPLILAVVTTNAMSQILLKQGMNTIGKFDFGGQSLARMLPIIALNPYVVGGLLVLVFSMSLHLMALSRVDLSFAYPFLSVSYVLVLVASYFWFGEAVNAYRIIGIALICCGTLFVARS